MASKLNVEETQINSLAKQLASNNPSERNRAVKKLKRWLNGKSNHKNGKAFF